MWNKKRSLFLQYKSKKIDGRYEMPAVLLQALADQTKKEIKLGKYTTTDQLRQEIRTW